ncbi:MAG: lipopolysaccharide kinase InaA family protein, partial [Methylococcaceae bacterium]
QTAADSTINLINSLHSLNISHGDLKISNFIIFGLKTSIIDLDSMKQHNSKNTFKKAQTKDLKRFLKNWTNDPSMKAMFKSQFDNSLKNN